MVMASAMLQTLISMEMASSMNAISIKLQVSTVMETFSTTVANWQETTAI